MLGHSLATTAIGGRTRPRQRPEPQASLPSPINCEGRLVTAKVGGFHVSVVQHENDHLDGILYPMRMTDFRQMGFSDEIARAEELALRMDTIRAEWASSSSRA